MSGARPFLIAVSTLLGACSTPPPVVVTPITPSAPLNEALYVGTAVGMQAKYGCTAAGCPTGLVCDPRSKTCRRAPSRDERERASREPVRACDAAATSTSRDGYLELCLLSATSNVDSRRLELQARNEGSARQLLTRGEARALERSGCATELAGGPLPSVSLLGPRAIDRARPLLEEGGAVVLLGRTSTRFELVVTTDPPLACELTVAISFVLGDTPVEVVAKLPPA